jgi:ESCRT-II complex subunit VPS22
MMRGGMGLGKVHLNKQMQENMSKMGQQLEKEVNVKLSQQLESFSKNLELFANKYKDEIRYNPDFREKFYSMCSEIGVDPLASISLWSKNLNLTEFYYNLAIQIITISMYRGPIIELNELRSILVNKIKMQDITLMDIQKAIESVSELKCGFQIIDIKNSKAVVTVPMQKSSDTDTLINLASENGGWIGYSYCFDKNAISKIRFDAAIVK